MLGSRRAASALVLALTLGCTPHGEREPPPVETPPPEPPPSQAPTPPDFVPPRVEIVGRPPPRPEPSSAGARCFPRRHDHPLGEWALSGELADLDGDGRPEVIVNYSLASTLGILPLDGEGLGQERRFRLQKPAIGVTVGDFNGDGLADIAASHSGEASVGVYLGVGEGRFADAPIINKAARYVGRGAVGDLNGDGRLDLVVPIWRSLLLLRGDGRGHLRVEGRVDAGQAPERPLLLDFSGDGRLDAAVPSNDEHHLALFHGRAGGSLKAAGRIPCGEGGAALAAFDLEGDGDLDLAQANIHSGDLCVFVGDGRGAFRLHTVLEIGGYANGVVAADFDRDGHVDLAAIAWDDRQRGGARDDGPLGDGVVVVLRGDGQGGLKEWSRPAVGTSPNEVWALDLNSDGATDLLTLNSNGRSLTILEGDGCRG